MKVNMTTTLFFIFIMSACALLSALGFWQLDRAAEKRVLLSAHADSEHAEIQAITADSSVAALQAFQPVSAEGKYLTRQQLLWDNRIYQHQVGYEVLTPFDLGEAIVLINRGWLPRGVNRETLPRIQFAPHQTIIYGNIHLLSRQGMMLGPDEASEMWPRVVQRIDFTQVHDWLGKPVLPFIIRLQAVQPYGYVRDWPITTMSPERHVAYAVQWFALALTLLILSIIAYVTFKREK